MYVLYWGYVGQHRSRDKAIILPWPSHINHHTKEADKMSAMRIITMAMEIKSKAKERYAALAEQTTDSDGQAMFDRLAEEEHANHRILSAAYWSLNNRGVWAWSRQIAQGGEIAWQGS